MSKTTKRRAAARVRTASAKGDVKGAAVHRDNHGRFTSSKSAPHASASVPMNREGRRQAAKASRTAGRQMVSTGGRQMSTPRARQTVPVGGRGVPRVSSRGLDSTGRLGRAS